ncbi:MAG TPA: adenosylcobinamide-GDP ribazoletransferase [Methylibium sp.]|nr:adenosylcobinamide-GDP ribazoletransferase [Methylibium sp.]
MSAPRQQARLFFVALQFLTRVPVPAWAGAGFQAHWLNGCVAWFPLVGALVGVWGAAVLLLAGLWWPPLVAALLAVAATLWLTGAFHEDGLADTFDALGGAVPRERALEIMKDSRIGTYGAAALGLALALRVALLAAIAASAPGFAALALVAAHLLGRTAAVAVMGALPYAGDADHAKAKPLATAPHRSTVRRAAVGALAMVGVIAAVAVGGSLQADAARAPWVWVGAVAATGAVVLAMRRWLARRLGGYTGDALGATEQLTEIAVLMVCAGGL